MKAFNINILAPDLPFYKGACESLIVPTLQGKYGILADHSDMIIAVVPGALYFRIPGEDNHRIAAVSHGLVEIVNNEVFVMVETVERAEDIDANRAKRAADKAREEILRNKSKLEYHLAEARLVRALNRLRVKGKYEFLQRGDK